MSASADPRPADAPAPAASPVAAARKPRFALFIATACGLGYIPKAPGTFGALAGCMVAVIAMFPWLPILDSRILPGNLRDTVVQWLGRLFSLGTHVGFWSSVWPCLIPFFVIGALGVWSASRVASHTGIKDPQHVVIDEVSGQHLTYLLGLTPLFLSRPTANNPDFVGYPFLFAHKLLSWKYLLLGFILFRVFDIWKPFPVRQAESLPGGWGIMADDWVAAVCAAMGLWVARAAGL